MQAGLCPTIARLSDAEETAAFAAMAHAHSGLRALLDRAAEWYLGRRGLSPGEEACFLLLGYDGREQDVRALWRRAAVVCRDHGGFPLGRRFGESWKRERFAHPYLRDILLGVGVMVDTVETATTWSNLLRLYEAMTGAIRVAISETGGGPGYVMTHISHIYPWGGSLYTTFLGRQVPGGK